MFPLLRTKIRPAANFKDFTASREPEKWQFTNLRLFLIVKVFIPRSIDLFQLIYKAETQFFQLDDRFQSDCIVYFSCVKGV